MRATTYPLLSVTRRGLVGPLASVMANRPEWRTVRGRALRAVGRLKPGGVGLLGLRVFVDERREFHAEPTGMLAGGPGKVIADGVVRAIQNKGTPLLERDGQLIYTLYQPPIPSAPAMKVLASRINLEQTGRPLPATATLQATTRCQADCLHCSAARHRRKDRPELSTEEFKSLLRQAQALGVVNIVFTGGEPLLRRDLFDLIAYVDKNEAIATMFTNGLLLTREKVGKLRAAGLFSVMVSIDSPDPEAHDRMRRVFGCWEKATDGIRRALEGGLLVGISTYATPERLHSGEVMEMIELGRGLGVHEITVFDVVPTGRLLREDAHVLLTEDDKRELCRLEDDINARSGYPHVITQAHVNGPTGAGCYAGWFQFYGTAYGDITPCDFTPLSYGNVRERPLADIWRAMTTHPAHCDHWDHCRMQDPQFRQSYVDRIPDAGPFPFPVERLAELPEAESVPSGDSGEARSSVGFRA